MVENSTWNHVEDKEGKTIMSKKHGIDFGLGSVAIEKHCTEDYKFITVRPFAGAPGIVSIGDKIHIDHDGIFIFKKE